MSVTMQKKERHVHVLHVPITNMTNKHTISTYSLAGINDRIINLKAVQDFKAIINKAHSLIL